MSGIKPPAAAAAAAVATIAAVAAAPAAAGVNKHKSHAPPTMAYKSDGKKAQREPGEGDDSGDGGGEHTKKGRGNGGRSKAVDSVARKVADLTATSDNRRDASTDAVSPRPSASSRMGEVSGMAPSAEIILLRQAREAAKKEAEAAGGGRRARAPSRRALEAAGRMTDRGAQWMTQEKKEEQARAAMELREQRKKYRAAGLKVGVVLEEFVVGKAETAATMTGAGGSGAGGSDSGIGEDTSRREGGGEAGGSDGVAPMPVVAGWRKVLPVALSVPLTPVVAHETAALVAAGEKP